MKFELPTLIYQEENCIKNHAQELCSYGKKALIITGRNSSKSNGSLTNVCDACDLRNITYVIFDEIEENPSVETCKKAASLYMNESIDYIIGVGGGSPLDASKAIALLLGNHTTDTDLFFQPSDLSKNALPVVCIPTTAGTGSEATPYAILTLHDQHTKKSISHRIFPVLALCDPIYLEKVPYSILKNTAVDTLAHLIESECNTNATSFSQMLCERGLSIWAKAKNALLTGNITKKDYAELMEASTIAGMAISHTGTSLPHGLSYFITYENHIPHGAACGLFLPGYMQFLKKHEENQTIPASSFMDGNETKRILDLLGLHNLQDFRMLLFQLLSKTEIDEDLLIRDFDALINNHAKLKNCPYPVNADDFTVLTK